MTRWVAFVALPWVVWGLLSASDTQAQSPAFDVASRRLNTDPPYMVIHPELRHGTLAGEKVTLRVLLTVAYGMTEPRVIGPDWLDKNRFAILAKSPPGVPDSELKPMLQTLLKERFKLAAHLETREMPVYFLDIGKGGVKMPRYPAKDRGGNHPADNPNVRGFPMMRGTMTTSQLANAAAPVVNRPVIDRSGLTERYGLFLSYAPFSLPAADHAADFGPPDFFKAMQEQLGLELESGKGNVEVVVIDHIEPLPTEN